MKSLSRMLILAGMVLASASALPAQHFVSSGFSTGYWGGYSGYGGYGYGWGSGFGGWSFSDFSLHHPEEHAPFGVGYAHGDSDFQSSKFMEYNEALELGKKILEDQQAPKPSLGDIVRRLHLRPSQSSSKAGSLILLQDNQGRLLVCRGTSANCRTMA